MGQDHWWRNRLGKEDQVWSSVQVILSSRCLPIIPAEWTHRWVSKWIICGAQETDLKRSTCKSYVGFYESRCDGHMINKTACHYCVYQYVIFLYIYVCLWSPTVGHAAPYLCIQVNLSMVSQNPLTSLSFRTRVFLKVVMTNVTVELRYED